MIMLVVIIPLLVFVVSQIIIAATYSSLNKSVYIQIKNVEANDDSCRESAPRFATMQACLSKSSGKFDSDIYGDVRVWGRIKMFGFYKFETTRLGTYLIYDEVCIETWKWKIKNQEEEVVFHPMEVEESFFRKHFIAIKKLPGKFDGPVFLFTS